MAVARKCDRCGDLYIPECVEVLGKDCNGIKIIKMEYRDHDGRHWWDQKTIDLCPKCMNSLAAWFEDLTI